MGDPDAPVLHRGGLTAVRGGFVAAVVLCGGLLFWGPGTGGASTLPEMPFPIGERLNYRIYWGIIPVGSAEAVTERIEEDGQPWIAIRIRAQSNNVVRRLYPVNLFIETLLDPDTLMPARFTKISREGRHRSNDVTHFDYGMGVARQHNRKHDRHSEFAIEPATRDLLSFMYFMRGMAFPAGSRTEHRVMADEKVYDLVVQSVREERVETAGGKRERGLLLEPDASFDGLFVHKGRMQLWITSASPMLILRAEVEIPLARVHMVLDR